MRCTAAENPLCNCPATLDDACKTGQSVTLITFALFYVVFVLAQMAPSQCMAEGCPHAQHPARGRNEPQQIAYLHCKAEDRALHKSSALCATVDGACNAKGYCHHNCPAPCDPCEASNLIANALLYAVRCAATKYMDAMQGRGTF